jgi:hypothetical protein
MATPAFGLIDQLARTYVEAAVHALLAGESTGDDRAGAAGRFAETSGAVARASPVTGGDAADDIAATAGRSPVLATDGSPVLATGVTGGSPVLATGATGGSPVLAGGATGGSPVLASCATGGSPVLATGATGGSPAPAPASGSTRRRPFATSPPLRRGLP